jgi:hypothetical protein
MSKTSRYNETEHARSSGAGYLRDFLLSILGGVAVLAIEYWSGLFLSPERDISPLASPLLAFLLIASVLSTHNAFGKWLKGYRYVREEFAFAALLAMSLFFMMLALSIGARVLPWYPLVQLVALLRDTPISLAQPHWAEYAFLLTVGMLLAVLFFFMHRSWSGLKSEEQHQREQNSEPSSPLLEALREWQRFRRREPPLRVYKNQSGLEYISQLTPQELPSLAWKDQAKALLCLSSSSYAFNSGDTWHDKAGCWVGENIDTHDMVFLFPRHTMVADDDIASFQSYAERITSASQKSPPRPVQHSDMFAAYEAGLQTIEHDIQAHPASFDDFLVYEQRLRENIGQARRYGDTPTSNAERGEIIDQLNDVIFAALGKTFNDVCDHAVSHQNSPARGQRTGYELIVAVQAKASLPNRWPQVQLETEQRLLEKLVNFTDYRNEIRKRVCNQRLLESDLTLNEVYVYPQGSLPDSDSQIEDIEAYLSQWLTEPGRRHLALLGEYGQGKSTVSLLFTYHLLSAGDPLPARIPLLIDLRGMSPRNLTPLQLLGAWASPYNINPQALLQLHRAGRTLLIFEGFDEMALIGDADMRLKHFKTLWDFAYPESKIVISGRPNFFLDDEEMRAALGIDRPGTNKPYTEILRLAPFTRAQIQHALRNHKDRVREQIGAVATQNPRFLDLVSRPSLLHVVAVLWEKENLSQKVDQLTSAYVMERFIRHSYLRQGVKQDESPEFMALTTPEREYFMKGVAAYMAAHNLPNQINNTQLNDLIDKLIDAMPETVSTRADVASGESRRPLQSRLQDTTEQHGREHVKTDVRSCGILVDDPAAPGTFRFGHKSFMEYLVAAVISERIQAKDADAAEAKSILKASQADIEDIVRLPVSIDFLAEMIGNTNEDLTTQEDQGQFVQQLLSTLVKEEGKIDFLIYRYGIMVRIIVGSLFRRSFFLSSSLSFLSALVSSLFWLFFLFLLFWIFSLLPLFLVFLLSLSSLTFLFLLLSVSSLLSFLVFFVLLIVPKGSPLLMVERNLQTIKLWNLLCRKTGMSDEAMHRVVGTWYVPWVKNRPFDFFLEEEKDQEQE